MPRLVVGRWEGGRIVQTKRGGIYMIRRRINGKLFELSTHSTSKKVALEHLRRFEKNPAAYTASGGAKDVAEGGLVLGDALIKKHLDAAKDAGVSPEWIRDKRIYLDEWAKRLTGRDLRTLSLLDLQQALDGLKARTHRIATIKAFYSWLRESGLVTRREDPSLDLKVPPAKPAQWTRGERSISREDFAETFDKLSPHYRDHLLVLGGTGMHVRELHRLAAGIGKVGPSSITIIHKSGRQHTMAVDESVADAAARLQKVRGPFSISKFMAAVRTAAKKAKVKPWSPGSLRHSVGTWLMTEGANAKDVADWLGHASEATLKRFYATYAHIAKPAPTVSTIRVVRRKTGVRREAKVPLPPIQVLTPPRPLKPDEPAESDESDGW